MRRYETWIGISAALALLGAWLLWPSKSQVAPAIEAGRVTMVKDAPPAGLPEALRAPLPVQDRPAKPADISGEVTYESISEQYPRAFSMTMTIGPPEGPALDAFKAAETALNGGNAHAGFTMFMAIKRCQEEEVTVRLRDLKRAESDPAQYQSLLAQNETTFRECEGVGPAEIARGYDGLKQAAERGDVSAQLYYPAIGAARYSSSTASMLRSADELVQFKADAMRFLNAAADRGSLDAIQELASVYKHGILVQRDFQKSYAYAYALYLLKPEIFSQWPFESVTQSLTEEQVLAARKQALLVLKRCCE